LAEYLRGFFERHRKKLVGIGAAITLYGLLGFFLAPWLIEKNAVDAVAERYAADLRIEQVAVNPFVLSLRVDGIELDDPAGNEFVSLDQVFVNFQLSSLFRRAFTFAEIRIDVPEVFLQRAEIGETNFAFLLAGETNAESQAEPSDSGIPRLLIYDFSLNEASLQWDDSVPSEPVVTTFGPVNARVQDLSTLPQGEGQQEVIITTETTGTFSWSGSLQLNPLRSSGRASVVGSHFPLTSAYIKDSIGFEAVEGEADIGLDYSIDTLDDGQLDVSINNLRLAFSDLLLRTHGRERADGSDADRDVLNVSSFRIDGGSLRYPEQRASIGSIAIEDSQLFIHRYQDGALNIIATGETPDEDPPEPAVDATASSDPWMLSLDQINISRAAVSLSDDSVSPQANLGIRDLNVAISEITNQPGDLFPTEVSLATQGGGSVSLAGDFGVLPTTSVDMALSVQGIALAFLHPYIKSLADVELDSGALGMQADLSVGAEEVLAVSGDLAVTEFLITETDRGTTLGSWDSIAANQFALSLSKETLDISEVQVDQAYGDIVITEDGSINLGRVALGEQVVVDEAESNGGAPDDEQLAVEDRAADEPLPLAITIGRVVVNNAAADFEDRSLPLPFDVSIAGLNGTLTTIASTSVEPSEAVFEGKVDEFGLVRVSGTVTPLEPALNTDLKIDFENVAMPKFSAYSVPFAGREIASGKLDLSLGYKLDQSELVGENKLVLRDFELGDKVEHPGASSLPLGLAVALLKNPDGTIDIDLPVRGNVDDPEFRYGGVVGKALLNLVTKIVTSPFALLGNLVGAEESELEFIAFQDGRADLTPPEQEKAGKLAEALALRPELSIEISGVVHREADGLAIQTARLDEAVEQEMEALSDESDSEQYAEQRLEVIEAMFGQKEVRDALRQQFTGEEGLDELAYTAELRRQLIDAYVLDETDFISLARRRASNVQAALLAENVELQRQIIVGELQEVDKNDGEDIQMKVVLTAEGGDG
jgi:uncharacterized protein involved in outer membrane biogenesis